MSVKIRDAGKHAPEGPLTSLNRFFSNIKSTGLMFNSPSASKPSEHSQSGMASFNGARRLSISITPTKLNQYHPTTSSTIYQKLQSSPVTARPSSGASSMSVGSSVLSASPSTTNYLRSRGSSFIASNDDRLSRYQSGQQPRRGSSFTSDQLVYGSSGKPYAAGIDEIQAARSTALLSSPTNDIITTIPTRSIAGIQGSSSPNNSANIAPLKSMSGNLVGVPSAPATNHATDSFPKTYIRSSTILPSGVSTYWTSASLASSSGSVVDPARYAYRAGEASTSPTRETFTITHQPLSTSTLHTSEVKSYVSPQGTLSSNLGSSAWVTSSLVGSKMLGLKLGSVVKDSGASNAATARDLGHYGLDQGFRSTRTKSYYDPSSTIILEGYKASCAQQKQAMRIKLNEAMKVYTATRQNLLALESFFRKYQSVASKYLALYETALATTKESKLDKSVDESVPMASTNVKNPFSKMVHVDVSAGKPKLETTSLSASLTSDSENVCASKSPLVPKFSKYNAVTLIEQLQTEEVADLISLLRFCAEPNHQIVKDVLEHLIPPMMTSSVLDKTMPFVQSAAGIQPVPDQKLVSDDPKQIEYSIELDFKKTLLNKNVPAGDQGHLKYVKIGSAAGESSLTKEPAAKAGRNLSKQPEVQDSLKHQNVNISGLKIAGDGTADVPKCDTTAASQKQQEYLYSLQIKTSSDRKSSTRCVDVVGIHKNPTILLMTEFLTPLECQNFVQVSPLKPQPHSNVSLQAYETARKGVGSNEGLAGIEKLLRRRLAAILKFNKNDIKDCTVVERKPTDAPLDLDTNDTPTKVLIFLDGVTHGGVLEFASLDVQVTPCTGTAVVWMKTLDAQNETFCGRLLPPSTASLVVVCTPTKCWLPENKSATRCKQAEISTSQPVEGNTAPLTCFQTSKGSKSRNSLPTTSKTFCSREKSKTSHSSRGTTSEKLIPKYPICPMQQDTLILHEFSTH